MSHGYHGWYGDQHDTAEALADAGFVVAEINHPVDSGPDMRRANDLSVLFERPADIKQLVDIMLESWDDHDSLDPNRVGFYGFSRGGYTGLVVIGGNPDIRKGIALCPESSRLPYCHSIRKNEIPARALTHDGRIKAAVLADPAFGVLFDADGLKNIKVPVQLWASTQSGDCMDIDGVCPQSVAALERNLSSTPDYHVVANATHLAFVAPCTSEQATVVPAICVDNPGFDRVLFHKEFNADVVAFFRKHLREP